jgi:adenylate kinase family enzyme
MLVEATFDDPTINSKAYRDVDFSDDKKRQELRERIVEECLSFKLLESEDNYCLGTGGLLPSDDVKKERQAVIITGLPASGKSTIALFLSKNMGAVFLDSDLVKRKFPEFNKKNGPDILHKEAGLLTFGGVVAKDNHIHFDIQSSCVVKGVNIIIQKIGADCHKIRQYRDALISEGYGVHFVYIHIERRDSVLKAIDRYQKSKRYVPLSLIYDHYGDNPALAYYRMRDDKQWISVTKVKDVKFPLQYDIIYRFGASPFELSGG